MKTPLKRQKLIKPNVFLGAVFLFLTAALSFKTELQSQIFLSASLGLSAIWLWPKKGFFFSLVLIFFYGTYQGSLFKNFWDLGLYISLILGLAICFCSYLDLLEDLKPSEGKEPKSKIFDGSWKEFHQEFLQEILEKNHRKIALEDAFLSLSLSFEELEKKLSQKEALILSYQESKKYLQKQSKELENRIGLLKGSQLKKEKKVAELEKLLKEREKFRILSELTSSQEVLKTAFQDKETSAFSLRKELVDWKEKYQQKEDSFQAIQGSYEQIKTIEPKYFQLKKQFEEKNQIIHSLRKELFHAQDSLGSLQKEKEEFQYTFHPEMEHLFQESAHLETQLEEMQRTEKELFSIIDHLNLEIKKLSQ